MSSSTSTIAYFSMEIALETAVPTYSGGLGVLAGDTIRSAADLGAPMVAITLLHRKGYFVQHLDPSGRQTETPVDWRPEEKLEPMQPRVTVEIEGRTVHVRAWQYTVRGVSGAIVPVFLLDTALPENTPDDQRLTDTLYGGDGDYRLRQEIVLGIGGVAMLRALGYEGEMVHHLNEGHASLATLALLERQREGRQWEQEVSEADVAAVRRQVVFTTHTPVPAGHDKFPIDMARRLLGEGRVELLRRARALDGDWLHTTVLALRFARYVNAVAMRHQEVSREMFPQHEIEAITNGVHAVTWTSQPYQQLFDRHIPRWRQNNLYLRYAVKIPLEDIRDAHAASKATLLAEVKRRTGVELDPKVMTIGFARRSTPYKRADLIFTDVDRLREMTRRVGPMQIVYAGKAHPHDEFGKQLIQRIYEASAKLGDALKVVYLENYDMTLGALLTSGSDVWLNTPLRPLEASGTSGMKAAMNGVPSFSTLDGWWIEGCVEGVTGWAIGEDRALPQDPSHDVIDLYRKLEQVILPLYYGLPYRWAEVSRNAIALNGSFFNTQRMVGEYLLNAYFPNGTMVRPLAKEPVA
ncbi:MAG TPA: alpha-glucan family phosphorylase [Gemmatimonadaceae bacterium]|nr:alpha-glucan family phosphorylase [Gemmatimonadaceae bacterium]